MGTVGRRTRRLASLASLALLLTGCLKLDMALTVSPDDTVDGEMVFAVNKELLELTGQSVDDVLDDATVPDDVDGATQEPYEDDRFVGTRVRFEDVALSDLRAEGDPEALTIERVGDTYEVSGAMDLSSDEAELEGNPFEDPIGETFDSAELRIAITFPGEVLETNGRVDGTTVTWEPVFGERTELSAVASASGEGAGEGSEGASGSEAAADEANGSGASTLWLVILGLVIVAGVIGAFVMTRRRSGSSPAATGDVAPSADAAAPPPPPPAPPSPPSNPVTEGEPPA